jgi:hypothetical protein
LYSELSDDMIRTKVREIITRHDCTEEQIRQAVADELGYTGCISLHRSKPNKYGQRMVQAMLISPRGHVIIV